MSEAELKLVTDAKNCTMYTIQFLSDDDSEFEKFYAKFRNELEYNEDFERLLNILGRIADFGALERFYIFRSIPVHHSGAAVSNLRGKNRLFLMSVRP